MNRARLFAATAVLALAGGITVASLNTASAAVLPSVPGNVTFLNVGPRLAPVPGHVLTPGQVTTIQVAGKTFSGVSIPANTTGLVLNVSSYQPQAAGIIRVWPTDTGQPGTPSVTFASGQAASSVVTVALNSEGKFNVAATANTNVLISVNAYVTPLGVAPAPVLKTIDAQGATVLEQVGGPIRGDASQNLKGATAFGSVTLTPGTWDSRVVGGFTGLNNTNKACTTDDNFLTGTMVLVKGEGSTDSNRLFDFDQVAATDGGVIVPESNSATLTQDPNLNVDTFITVTENTKVTVRLFGYASNSSTDCTGTLKGNLQSAQFLKVA